MDLTKLFQIIEQIEYTENAVVCGAPEPLITGFQQKKEEYLYTLVKQLSFECKNIVSSYEKKVNIPSQTYMRNTIQSTSFPY